MSLVTTATLLARAAVVLVPVVLVLALVAACTPSSAEPVQPGNPRAEPVAPDLDVARVCDATVPGPEQPPPGAVVVDPAVDRDLAVQTERNPAGSTFWLAPGVHTLGTGEFSQVQPRDGNVYVGAPGAVLDGRGLNNYAFAGEGRDVTIRHLTVRGFTPPVDQGVVNHNSANGWVIEHATIERNQGAGLMAGAGQVVRYSCLRDNGQYGMNAYQPGNAIRDLVLEFNEITGNNTDDWETRQPGCGCTGGVKFWAVDGADVRGNWVHDNRGAGLWADTNNNDFLIEGNLIERNDAEAVFYETSYNLVLRGNVIRENTWVTGRGFADRADDFPAATVYLSEAGGEPRVPARTDRLVIEDNLFENNWSGVTVWENADRFCNSPANTSTGDCTLLVEDPATCVQPGIAREPLYDDCRWKSQRVDVRDNTFVNDPAVVGCHPGYAGRMAVLSNFGTFPDWSPYRGDVVQRAIVTEQDNRWSDNTYTGPWTFLVGSTGRVVEVGEWRAAPILQDTGSTFDAAASCG